VATCRRFRLPGYLPARGIRGNFRHPENHNRGRNLRTSLLRRGLALRVEGKLDFALAIQRDGRGEVDLVQRNRVLAAVIGDVVETVALDPIVGQPVHPAVFQLQQRDHVNWLSTICGRRRWRRA